MRETIILDFGRRSGKSKALKELLKNKKITVVKVGDETYEIAREREEKSFNELEKKTVCFNEWQKISSKKLKTLLDKNVNFNLEQTQKIYKSWFMGINEEKTSNKNNNCK